MSRCDRKFGQDFLAGALSADEQLTLADHLETCPRCTEWLEQDAGNEVTWQFARELASDTRVMEPPARDHADDIPAPVDVLRQLTPWLGATDDPAMLGRFGPYEISGLIGRGGMGIVLKGHDRALLRNVAVKVLDPLLAGNGSARKRFSREAKAMAAVAHEYVVPIFAIDEYQGLPYLVMEYVSGGSLESRIVEQGPLEVVSIVRVALQIATALAAAHSHGLIHRDIKPGNILVDRGTDRVRVADFGLARVAHETHCTHTGAIAGTPQFMSPEQVRGEDCDTRSDLFSLGCVMYAMCVGHPPFRADTVYGVMQRIVHDRPRELREQNPRIPDWLARFVERLLRKDPAARFATAGEAAEILQQELAHLEGPTRTPPPNRSWANTASTRSKLRPLHLIIVLFFALSAAIAAIWIRPSPDHERQYGLPSAHSAQGAAHSSSPSDGATILLWDDDGTETFRSGLWQLELSYVRSGPQPDMWQAEVQHLRQRLIQLNQETY